MMILGYDILDDLGPRQTDTTQTVVAEAETVDDRTPADFYREVVDQACTHLVTFLLEFQQMDQGELMRRILDEVTAAHQANFPECPLPQVVCREIWLPGFQNTDNSFEALVNAVDCEHVITDAAHDLTATYKIPISLKYGTRRNIFRLMNLCASVYAIYQNDNYKCRFFNGLILPVHHKDETDSHYYVGQLFGVPFLKKFHKLIRASSDTLASKERRYRLQMIDLLTRIVPYATREEITQIVHLWFNRYSKTEEEKMNYSYKEMGILAGADKLARNSIYGNLTNKQ